VTSSPFKNVCDSIAAHVALSTSSSFRAEAPFYIYGVESFDTSEGVPPQVRWAPAETASISIPSLIQSSTSFASWRQPMRCRVWGADESEVISEVAIQLRSALLITQVSGSTLGGAEVTWIEHNGSHSTHGVMAEFIIDVDVTLPKKIKKTALILTASADISGSAADTHSLEQVDFMVKSFTRPAL